MTLTAIITQPHVLRELNTYFASSTKNVEFETAAMPYIRFIPARSARIVPAKSTQPSPGMYASSS